MGELLSIIGQSLSLDQDLWRDLLANADSVRFRNALWIVTLAGLAEAVAQSAVLFLNQVKPRRFVLSLGITAIIFVFGYFFYVLSISLIARVLYQADTTAIIFYSISLAYAPLILSFLIMMPYFGRAISAYLNVYHVLALIVAVSVTYALEPRQALVCVAGGWLLIMLLKATIGRPLIWLARSSRNRAAGKQLVTGRKELKQKLHQPKEKND